MSQAAATLIERTDRVLQTLEDEEVERLNKALDASYLQLEKELLRRYPDYTAEAKPNLLATQRGVLLAEELKNSLILLNPEREKEITERFERLLQTSSQEGTTLADELIKLQTGDDFVVATATIPIEAVGFAARDAVKRLKRHDEKFQEEAVAIISQGLIQGQGARKVSGFLRQRLGVTKGRAEAIARTEIISAQDSATRANYKANNISYVIRIATQDTRVCGWCAERAGKVYPVDDAPAVIHPRDRCYNAPWLPEYEESDPKQSEWIKRHSADAQAKSQEGLRTDPAPFERLNGLKPPSPVWTPKDGYLDKTVEDKGQNWALGLLGLRLLTGGKSDRPNEPPPPEVEDNQLLKALVIGAAIAGVTVGSYYLARQRIRGGYKKSAQMAEELATEFADLAENTTVGDTDQITLAIGGFNNKKGQAGLEQAQKYQEFLENHKVVGITNPNFETSYDTASQPAQKVADIIAKTVDVTLIQGRNPDAVRMAAAAIAFHKKHGRYPNLIGYSGGGLVVREAHEILKAYGAKDFKSISVAAPYLGIEELSPDEHIDILNENDLFSGLPQLNGVRIKPLFDLSSAVEAHELEQGYLSNPKFPELVKGFFSTDPYQSEQAVRQARSEWANFLADLENLNPRDRYRAGFKKSAQMAREMAAEFERMAEDMPPDDKDEVSFIAGGFAGLKGQAGLEYAEYFQEFLDNHLTVGVPTPEFDTDIDLKREPFRHLAESYATVARTIFIEGRNPSAVRMAAMAYAYYKKHGKPVNLVGYSGGGFVAGEAAEILKLMGVPTKTVEIGSPYLGITDLRPEEHITLMGKGDVFGNLPIQNGKVLDDVKAHWLNAYLDSPTFVEEIRQFLGVKVAQPQTQQRREPKRATVVVDDEVFADYLPQVALLSEDEIKSLPKPIAQKLLTARRNAIIKAPTAGQLAQARSELAAIARQVKDIELAPLDLGEAQLETLSILSATELEALPARVRAQIEGFKARGELPAGQPNAIALRQARDELARIEQETGLTLTPIDLGEAQLESLSFLSATELEALPAYIRRKIEGYKTKALKGRLDPKQLPGIPELKALPGYDALLALPEAQQVRGLLRGQLPPLLLPAGVELGPVTELERRGLQNRIAQNLYRQSRSVERGISRLAEFRVREAIAKINRQNLPPTPKLAALRKALYDEISAIATLPTSVKPPGAANSEEMTSFDFGGLRWYAPGQLKETSPVLDLTRKLAALGLPDELLEHTNELYITRQKNASEEFWRKKLKLSTPQVPATVNLESGAITFYRGRGKVDDALRQMAYLAAYRRFGQLEPPEGSDYWRAMQEGRPSTAYALGGPAQDFADSVKEFFLDPDHLKRFAPQRYEAISRMFNFRHPEKPATPASPPAPTTEKPKYGRAINQVEAELDGWLTLTEELRGSIKDPKILEQLNEARSIFIAVKDRDFPEESIRFIQDEQGRMQAIASIEIQKDDDGDFLYLDGLATAPWNFTDDPRAVSGAGRALLVNIAKEALAKLQDRIKLNTAPGARGFYEKLGFQAGDPKSANEMVLELPGILKLVEAEASLKRKPQSGVPDSPVDDRSPQIIADLRTQNATLADQIKHQRDQVRAIALQQRSTKKTQAIITKVNEGQVQAEYEGAASQLRIQEESLNRLEQQVEALEQRSAQLLNPLQKPYFSEAPARIKATQRQLKAVEKELGALSRVTALTAKLRTNAQELQQVLSDLTTRRESLKASSQGAKLTEAIAQLQGGLDQAEQELINLPRSAERSQALRDMQRLKAAINSQSGGVSVADLHRQGLEPRIRDLTQLADNLEELEQRLTRSRNGLSDLQVRLSRLPSRVAELSEEQQQRYAAIKRTRGAQGKLPQRVESYRELRGKFADQLAQQQQQTQQLADSYNIQRQAAIANVQAIVDSRLERVSDNLQILASLKPGSIAWLVDSRNWENDMPNDIGLVLARQPGVTRNEKLKAAADYVTNLVGQVGGAIKAIEKRLEYPVEVSREVLKQTEAQIAQWQQIRDALADEGKLSDRQLQELLKDPARIKAVDVIRYGNQLTQDLEQFNQDFVNLLLEDDGADPKVIIEQSELYRRSRQNFVEEAKQARASIAREIEDALAVSEALRERVAKDSARQPIYEVHGRTMTLEQLRAELQQAKDAVADFLKIKQVQAQVQATEEEEARQQQRQQEFEATRQREQRLQSLRSELGEVGREIQKRREAAARGQKRGISTDRLEAQERRILRDIAQLSREYGGNDGEG